MKNNTTTLEEFLQKINIDKTTRKTRIFSKIEPIKLTGTPAKIAELYIDKLISGEAILTDEEIQQTTHGSTERDYFIKRSIDVQMNSVKKFMSFHGASINRVRQSGYTITLN